MKVYKATVKFHNEAIFIEANSEEEAFDQFLSVIPKYLTIERYFDEEETE